MEGNRQLKRFINDLGETLYKTSRDNIKRSLYSKNFTCRSYRRWLSIVTCKYLTFLVGIRWHWYWMVRWNVASDTWLLVNGRFQYFFHKILTNNSSTIAFRVWLRKYAFYIWVDDDSEILNLLCFLLPYLKFPVWTYNSITPIIIIDIWCIHWHHAIWQHCFILYIQKNVHRIV